MHYTISSIFNRALIIIKSLFVSTVINQLLFTNHINICHPFRFAISASGESPISRVVPYIIRMPNIIIRLLALFIVTYCLDIAISLYWRWRRFICRLFCLIRSRELRSIIRNHFLYSQLIISY